MKCCNRVQQGKNVLSQHVDYLKRYCDDQGQSMKNRVKEVQFNKDTPYQEYVNLYQTFAAMQAFKAVKIFEDALASGDKDMFDVYLNQVPYSLTTLAVAFGEVFYLESYQRRLAHLTCEKTKRVFYDLGTLFAVWNIIDTRIGDFRESDLLSSD